MSSQPPTEFPIHPLLHKRVSPRAFAQRPIERTTLRSLLEAARWAPSSYNEQPWALIVASSEDQSEFERMLSCLLPGNRLWASAAPVLMISVAKLHFERNGRLNRHAYHDVGLAVSQMTLQATSVDLVVHQMAGFDAELARQTYAIPGTWDPVAAIAIGFSGDPETLPDALRERESAPRERKTQEDFVFSTRWGQSY